MAGWKPLSKMKILGSKYPRVEAPQKVSGKAIYTYDVYLPGMLYGAILSSPYPSARIVHIDASRVKKHPGVKAVLIDIHPTGTIRYAGEEVAAVAAVSLSALEEALSLFQIEYEKKPFVVDLEEAMKPDAPQVYANRSNVKKSRVREEGNVDEAFRKADVVVEAEFRTQVQVHVPLEPHGSVVKWEGDELIIWDSTQAVHGVREGVARYLDIPVSKVRVICHHMGGGFGSKLWAGRYTAIAARLARIANAPVKLMLTRKQDFLMVGNRPNSIQHLKLGATREGKLIAFFARTYGTAGIATNAGVHLPIVYHIPNWRHEHADVFTNAGGGRPFRAPGCPQAAFAMEQMMDEMAEKLGMDPLQFRLKNDPSPTRHKEWAIGAREIGWEKRSPKPGSDKGPIKRGIGLAASIWWPGGRETHAAMTIQPDGTVEVRCGTQDIGTGTRTYVASVAAEELGIPMHYVHPKIGDSLFPYAGASGGSTTSPSVAPTIKVTADKAKTRLTMLAAKYWEVKPAAIRWEFEKIVNTQTGEQLSWSQLCQLLTAPLEVHGEWQEGLSSAGVAGCQFAQVAVDTETGRIKVEKIVAVADCGLILNRLTTESQVHGGIVQGISYALLEERFMDPTTGMMVNTNYHDYKIAGSLEIPEIKVILYDEPERGVIGIGEPPTIPTAAAIANAFYNATGVRLRELPMTPDRVLNALYSEKRVYPCNRLNTSFPIL